MNDPRETAAPVAAPEAQLVVIRYGNLYDLAANTYTDTSGGSLESLTLTEVEVFGELVLDARAVAAIRVVGGAQPHEVTTHDGSVYRRRAPRLWLATPTMRINLSNAPSLVLRRSS